MREVDHLVVIEAQLAARVVRRWGGSVGAGFEAWDGSVVNKVGSYPLALVARENVIPYYVACESIKWDPRNDPDKFIPKQKDAVEMFRDGPDNLNIRNIYFERIAPELITKIVTEKAKNA